MSEDLRFLYCQKIPRTTERLTPAEQVTIDGSMLNVRARTETPTPDAFETSVRSFPTRLICLLLCFVRWESILEIRTT